MTYYKTEITLSTYPEFQINFRNCHRTLLLLGYYTKGFMMTAVLKQKIDAFHLLIETNPYIAQQKVYDFWNDVSDDPHLFFKAEPVERDALINALSRALRSDVIHPLAVSIGYQLQNHPEKSTLFTWAMMVKPLASLNETEDPSEKIAREVDLLRSTFHNWNLNQQTQSDM